MPALAVALILAYAAGLNLYAAIAVVGIGDRLGWIGPLPGSIAWLGDNWVLAAALVLYVIEFGVSLVPGVASAWETLHSMIRPPAAAILAAMLVWRDDPQIILAAALLGGLIALSTSMAKLGARYVADSASNRWLAPGTDLLELSLVLLIVVLGWRYPLQTLALSLAALVSFIIVVRPVLHVLRQVFTGHWTPACGPLQEPRTVGATMAAPDREED